MDIAGVDVEIDVIKEYPELEDLVVNPSAEEQSFNSNKYGFKSVKINAIKGEELDLNPSTEEQKLEGVFTKVKFNAIKTQKLNTVPSTQEQVITGLFDEVTVNAIEGQELNLNPSEEQQNYEGVFLGVNINPIQVEEITTDLDFSDSDAIELKAQEGVYIKKAIINKDVNLTPENIKSGVSIAGISGDVADTSDADATSNDIIAGKTAYVANEKIAGTYIPLDTSDATATAEDIVKDKTAYVNGEKVIGTMEAGNYNAVLSAKGISTFKIPQIIREIDFTEIDTSEIVTFNSAFNGCKNLEKIIGDIDCSKATNMGSMFYGCSTLKGISLKNTNSVTDMNNMCHSCSLLVDVPLLNTKSLSNNQYAGTLQYAFYKCTSLSDESLNNILAMCTNAIKITYNKTLEYVGLTKEQATRCQSLSNYQAFLDAGWQTGY